ncbi:hypothetical protein [Aquimarina rubra]|uniref:Uncharacterized protein n=1 Tax=Aquimarina rubra TaxID=1920033 RepID=A0ABW5LKN0_9FLAO
MSKINSILILIHLFFFSNLVYSQDTIYLQEKPRVILKSWYPEFKEFPKLKVGESKIIFTKIPDFEKTSIWNNDIDLKTFNSQVEIEETDKTNQYFITVNSTNTEYIEFELWFELGNNTIFLKQNSKWRNIKDLYPLENDRLLIDKIKLELTK